MKVELSSEEVEKIAFALKREAKAKVMENEITPRDDQILNAADAIKLANRLLIQNNEGKSI